MTEGGRRGRGALQVAVAMLIGAVATWMAVKDVEVHALLDVLRRADVGLLALSTVSFAGMHVLRAARFSTLLQGLAPHVGFRSSLSVCSVGFFLINVLPFRLGEFARPYLLADREDVPFGSGMASVVMERVLDLAAVGAIFLGAVLLSSIPSDPVVVAGQPYDVVALGRVAVLGVLGPVVVAIVALLALGERGERIADRVFALLGRRLGGLASRFLRTFNEALRSMGSLRTAAVAVGWTVAAWILNVASIEWMLQAFDFGHTMGFWDAAVVLSCIAVGLMLPAPPGFAGVFELAVAIALGIYAVGPSSALAFALVVHAAQLGLLSSFGFYFIAVDGIGLGGLVRGLKQLGQE